MVIILSYIIAVILTILIAMLLYPLSGLLFVIGKIGSFIEYLGKLLFTHTNSIIVNIWNDIKHTKVVKDTPSKKEVTENTTDTIEEIDASLTTDDTDAMEVEDLEACATE